MYHSSNVRRGPGSIELPRDDHRAGAVGARSADHPRTGGDPEADQDLPSLPVTAVGKLFKPALVDREIEETVRAEADRVGATVTSVTVDRDPNVGLRATVRAATGARK